MSNSKQPEVPEQNKEQVSGGYDMDLNLGLCQICLYELGKNPMAATKCGHTFCKPCIEAALKVDEHCPTCRCILKGEDAYHDLQLA